MTIRNVKSNIKVGKVSIKVIMVRLIKDKKSNKKAVLLTF